MFNLTFPTFSIVTFQHFYRQGLLEVSDTLVREANLQVMVSTSQFERCLCYV